MINEVDILRAIKTFKEWDNERRWKQPSDVFIHHSLEKSDNALRTAQYILKIMTDNKLRKELDANDYNGTLWIINSSYYRIFFLAQYLLALDKKKLPEDTQDTHKTVELALIYYYIIKESGLEGKNKIKWTDVKESKMSKALELLSDAKEETQELTQQRAKLAIEHIQAERTKRHSFTYKMTVHAEIEKAKTSIKRAIEFGDIIKEYIHAKRLKNITIK